mgnify:FL=1
MFLSPTEVLRSALPPGELHPALGRSSTSSQAYSRRPDKVLLWEHVEPVEAGGGSNGGGGGGNGGSSSGGGGGGGSNSPRLFEAICDHQDSGDALYGRDLR